jgi:hypothetical protein
MIQVWAEIGTDEELVKSMEKGKAFADLENFFGKADKPKVEKKEKTEKKKGPQTVNLLGGCIAIPCTGCGVSGLSTPLVNTPYAPLYFRLLLTALRSWIVPKTRSARTTSPSCWHSSVSNLLISRLPFLS